MTKVQYKKEIKSLLDAIPSYYFEVSIDRMKEMIEEWEIHYGEKGFRKLFLEYIQAPYSDHMEYHLYGWRRETDAELLKRVDKESKEREKKKKEARERLAKRDAKDLLEYQRLKKKYEGEQNA